MSEAAFESLGSGRFRVSGSLGFETVPALWAESNVALANVAEPTIDLGGVTQVDSAGLALVIEWIRWARAHERRIGFSGLPEKLIALARISEIDSLLANQGASSISSSSGTTSGSGTRPS